MLMRWRMAQLMGLECRVAQLGTPYIWEHQTNITNPTLDRGVCTKDKECDSGSGFLCRSAEHACACLTLNQCSTARRDRIVERRS